LLYRPIQSNNCTTKLNYRFKSLPVTEDVDEAPHIYGYMCDLIQSNNPIVLGANNANLPRIVALIADAFSHGVIRIIPPTNENIEEMTVEVIQRYNDVAGRMLNIVKQIETNPEVFQACVQFINEEQKRALEEALKVFSHITAA
jgi:hypothetical protein